jgi:phosphoribosylformimino-5-aminoimidazole carboxamide ribotide isomerase
MNFSIIPVLDVKDGRAVHAVGGTRDLYQPMRTILHEGSRPIDVARAYRDRLRLHSLYLADLDAITGGTPHLSLYESLMEDGFELFLDAGLRDRSHARRFVEHPDLTLIVGLETVQGPFEAKAILDHAGPGRVIFSLDQCDGRPLTASPDAWTERTSAGVADRAIELGFERLLLLDLARVGTGRGPGSIDLLRHLRCSGAAREILVGGGISGMADIRRLKEEGASGVLVGSVLHDGRVGLGDLSSLKS